MKCHMVRKHIKAYLDGEVAAIMRWSIARHLAGCVDCSMEAEAMVELAKQVKTANDAKSPEGLREKVLSRVCFEPASAQREALEIGAPRRNWPYATKPIAVVGVLLVTMIAAATLAPIFTRTEPKRIAQVREQASKAAPVIARRDPGLDDRRYSNSGNVYDGNRYSVTVAQKAKAARPPVQLAKPLAGSITTSQDSLPPICEAIPPEGCVPTSITSKTAKNYLQTLFLVNDSAQLTVLVSNFAEASNQAVAIAKSAGGYVADSQVGSDANGPFAETLTLEVPATRFERVMAALEKLGTVKSRSVCGKHVSGEFISLQPQLKNSRAEEQHYLNAMNRAKPGSDTQATSAGLQQVQANIGQMTQRSDYLSKSAAMSTITLYLTEKYEPQMKPVPHGTR